MSHELHLSKLIKKINFLLFSFPSSPIPCRGINSFWGPGCKPVQCGGRWGMLQLPWWSASLLGAPGSLLRPAQGSAGVGWHSQRAVGLTWKPPQLGFGLFGNSSLCWGSSPVYLVSPRGCTCRPYVLKHVQWDLCWVLCFSPEQTPRSPQRDWGEQCSAGAAQPSKPLMHHQGAWSQAWFQPVSGAGESLWDIPHLGRILLSTSNMHAPQQNAWHRVSDIQYHFIQWYQFQCPEFAVLPESSFTVKLLTTQAFCNTVHWSWFSLLLQTGTVFISSSLYYAAF